MSVSKVLNTLTNRWIKTSGITYKRLISSGFIQCGEELISVNINEIDKIHKDTILSDLRHYHQTKRIKELETQKRQRELKHNLLEEFSYHPVYVKNLLDICKNWQLIKVGSLI